MANITYIPYAQQQAAIDRQRKFAELLQQQAQEPLESQQVSGIVVPTSPWLGLAKMLQAGIGGYYQGKAAKRESEMKEQARKEAGQQVQDFISALGPQKGYEPVEKPAVETRPYERNDFASDEEYEAYRSSPDYLKTVMVKPTQWSDETGQYEPVYDWKETTKPGLSRNEALARLLQMKQSDNPYLADATSILSGVLPKAQEANIGAINPENWTAASLAKYANTGDYNVLVPRTEIAKTPNLPDIQENWNAVNADRVNRGLTPIPFEQFYNDAQSAKVASNRPAAPSGYQYAADGSLVPVRGGPADVTAPQRVPASVAATATEQHQNAARFKDTGARLRAYADKIESGDLPLGVANRSKYFLEKQSGNASDAANDYYNLQSLVQEQVNNLLNLAKGPQTEQDALRIQKIIMDNWNDEKIVRSRLRELADKLDREAAFNEEAIVDTYRAFNQESPYATPPAGAVKRNK